MHHVRDNLSSPFHRRRGRGAFSQGLESKYLAGGHTLIPVMKQRLASPSDVIDLGKIKELIGVGVFPPTR